MIINLTRFICICIIALLTVSISFAQGEYLDTGKTGYGISGSFSKQDESEALGLAIGVSYLSYIDFVLSVGRSNSKYSENFITLIGPGVAIHPIKDNNLIPISLSLNYSHSFNFMGDNTQSKISGNTYSAYLHKSVKLSERITLYPNLGYLYADVQNNAGWYHSSKSNGSFYTMGLNLRIREESRQALTLGLAVMHGEETTSVIFSLGTVLESRLVENQN